MISCREDTIAVYDHMQLIDHEVIEKYPFIVTLDHSKKWHIYKNPYHVFGSFSSMNLLVKVLFDKSFDYRKFFGEPQ